MVETDGVREVSDDEMTRSRLKSVIPVVCWKADMLSEIVGREKRQELRSKVCIIYLIQLTCCTVANANAVMVP